MEDFLIVLSSYAILCLFFDIRNYLKNSKCNHVLGYGYSSFVRKNDNITNLRLHYISNSCVNFNYCLKCGQHLDHEKIKKRVNEQWEKKRLMK